ncbi:MAG TPA: hypothetical protein VK184_12320 [Nostocaceae cyanobacterium]|nr:hypothetical protein [Nostocaceae cyanobacterium]
MLFLFLECDQISVSDLIRWPTLTQFIENTNSLIVISTQERFPQRQRSIINYDLPSLSYGEQFNIWQNYLGEIASKLNGHLSTIVSQFNLSPATIQTACLQLHNSEPENLASQIWRFCRTQARPSLDDLAQRIESNTTWKDLIIRVFGFYYARWAYQVLKPLPDKDFQDFY